jgi:uncharacterized Ntn-hydrolase superfamily protein
MTFSIVARVADAAFFGVGIASSSPAVAARCVCARAGVGAAASQNLTNPALGPAVLSMLGRGIQAQEAVEVTFANEPYRDHRQLLAIGRTGPPSIRSGAAALGVHSEAIGMHSAAAGNLLACANVPAAMVAAFEAARGNIANRILAALRAAMDAGGEAGAVHSAGLYVVRDVSWPVIDLRVDWVEIDPIGKLSSIYDIYEPQMDAYVQRARNPAAAPGFNVPGDPGK